MWIRRPTQGYDSKAASEPYCALHLLWKDDAAPIYIMDNHRAALWCWMNSLRREDRYTFFHLDFHWDLSGYGVDFTPLEARFDEVRSDLEAFDKLEPPAGNPFGHRMLTYENYIRPFFQLFANADAAHFGACQSGDTQANYLCAAPAISKAHRASELLDRFPQLLANATSRTIINVDLDLFDAAPDPEESGTSDDPPIEAARIAPLFAAIRKHLHNAHAVTIALSPECMRGWDDARRACGTACDALEIENPFAHLDFASGPRT